MRVTDISQLIPGQKVRYGRGITTVTHVEGKNVRFDNGQRREAYWFDFSIMPEHLSAYFLPTECAECGEDFFDEQDYLCKSCRSPNGNP